MVSHHFLADSPLVKDTNDLRRVAVPSAAYYDQAGYGEMVDAIRNEVGERLALIGDCGSGTLAFHVSLRGMDAALLDLYDNPGLVNEATEIGIRQALERARFFVSHGINILRYNDSAANMNVISPEQWREFVLPRLAQFCAGAHKLSPEVKVYCHICGNILPVARDLASSGLDCVAPLDPAQGMTVADVRRQVGDQIALMGGVSTNTLLRGAPEMVLRESRECIRQSGGRFILGSGCVAPRDTPFENLNAMRQAAVEWKE